MTQNFDVPIKKLKNIPINIYLTKGYIKLFICIDIYFIGLQGKQTNNWYTGIFC